MIGVINLFVISINAVNYIKKPAQLQITHWLHPRFHAYFPSGNSYPSILGEMLNAGLGIVGFTWVKTVFLLHKQTGQ